MGRWIIRAIILVGALVLFCGCEKVASDPQIPYGLLIKCRDFLAFCIFLANQEKPYYNHIAQRYYYAMLAIASISFQWNKGHGWQYKVVKHDEVWKLMPHDVKKLYGEDLKGLRTRCDYHYEDDARDMDGFKNDLFSIASEEEKVFPQLNSKVRADYAKFFGGDDSIKVSDCDALMEEIEVLHEKVRDMLKE